MSSENTICYNSLVTRIDREKLNGHKSVVIWFTGLSGSGKSTIAHEVEKRLFGLGCRTFVFDGDNVRHGLCGDLDFTPKDRKENIRRIGEMVKLFLEAGMITLSAFISPYKADRSWLRELISPENFIEIYCRCPIEVCEKRDVKGLYAKARAGLIANYTGVSSPYEEPENSDVVIDTNLLSPEESVNIVLDYLINDKMIKF
ncbi:MAG: adenylyl-sulfate kinase [Proteobacteria bacterium]|nr:adenylyl-sulfate kinase [Pseudomonadota bacterium]MBU4011118.1 adenylyl-sulfate kinase [Pseudomonadota bacterium]